MKLAPENRKGFTLLEVLVVIALTSIVMLLVFKPLLDSFHLTRRTEGMIRAQDDARLALSQVSRDIADAMFIYDNTRTPISFPMVDADGNAVTTPPQVYYAKIDLLLPRMRAYCTSDDHPAGESREFTRGEEAAPVCKFDASPLELRPVQPLAQDTKIVRYFIGLRDPGKPYFNPYATKRSGEANMYVLYRAEFNLFDPKLFPAGESAQARLADPNFFYNTDLNPDGDRYCDAWKRICRAVVTIDHTDLVTVDYKNDGTPVVTPSVTFAPTSVQNDPMVPLVDKDNSPEAGGDVPPAVYRATYGNWVLTYDITLQRSTKDGGPAIYKTAVSGGDMWIYKQDSDGTLSKQVFNISEYDRTKGTSLYGAGTITPANPELAFTVDTSRGMANFAIPHVDTSLSSSVAGELGGNTSVSFRVPTSEVNSIYSNMSASQRYRMYMFNLTTNHDQTWGSQTFNFTDTRMLANSTVVPGMERIIGPNCTQGDLYGRPTTYSRIPFWDLHHEPGMNEYKLDVDYPVVDDSGAELPVMKGAAALFFQADQTENTGGIRLPEAADVTGISGAITDLYVLYFEQNNKKGDSIRANYVTKSLITVTMGVRVFDPNSGKPQAIQLTNKVRVRNSGS